MREFIFLIVIICVAEGFRHQAVAVKGRLMCGSQPARNTRVKLWEEDSGPDPDDLLDQGYTDSNGEFFLKGDTMELSNIDPILKVYHGCDDGIKPGKRKIRFKIPHSYTNNGKTAKRVFDMMVINLETIFKHEERELIVS